MAENYEPGKWDAVVCNGFAAVNVLSSTNVEELGWDYTEMELDPAGRHVGFFTVSSRTSRNLAIISAPGEISLLSRRKRREKRAVRPARRIAIPKDHEGSQGIIKCN
ncbi:hypothetical protein [Collinsella sp. OM08-14AT]|uniref:hypothetical protein n=1 Tax=Collinsella sp. OM08-14AT TaxID=2292329 RepID=UPI001314B6F9|nr:hypothetical protein [Collinsella sp. OM08-14AT]